MHDSDRLSQREALNAPIPIDCAKMARHAGDGACREVLKCLCQREQAGLDTTVWDLQKVAGLPLHEAFAALRTLEFGKLVQIADNPSDPFGALVTLRDEGVERLMQREAA